MLVKQAFVSLGAIYGTAKVLCKYCMVYVLCFLEDFVHTERCIARFLYCY